MKNILITGASRGLGLATTKLLLEKKYTVFAINRTITKELEELRTKYGEQLKVLEFDLSNTRQIKSTVVIKFIGIKTPIHGFINNAAFAYDDIVTNLNLDSLDEMYKVNVFAPMMLTKYAIRSMLYHRISGSIVHLSSISVHTGYKGLAMYASTKGALEAFSKNTAREWGETGVRSNCLVAGFMETDMSKSLNGSLKKRIYQRTCLKKATEMTSVAETIIFLLSEKAQSITAQNIHVDSGTI